MSHCLLLNADAQPMSLIPLSTQTWQDSITGIFNGKMRPLHFYDNWYVHSPSTSMQVPSVCILTKQVKVKHRFSASDSGGSSGPQHNLVFLRDLFTCQYCLKVFAAKHLTIDHVLPKSKGGLKTWQNTASACSKCNTNKGNDERIRPANPPKRPTYDLLVRNARKFPLIIPSLHWNYYIGHPEELTILKEPKNTKVLEEKILEAAE